MTVSEQRLVVPDAPAGIVPSYARPQPGNHQPLDFPPSCCSRTGAPSRRAAVRRRADHHAGQ